MALSVNRIIENAEGGSKDHWFAQTAQQAIEYNENFGQILCSNKRDFQQNLN